MRGANPTKTDRSRRLRRGSTDAETKLWHHLRSRGLRGTKFVRQLPIGPFVVDFVCRERHLIIEVDGGQHADSAEALAAPQPLTRRASRVDLSPQAGRGSKGARRH